MTQQNPENTGATTSVVKVSRDLTEILNLSQALTAQAIQKANDRQFPGGNAMAALGPVADPAIYEARMDAHERRAYAFAEVLGGDLDDYMPELYDEDRDETPFQKLRFIAARWRAAHAAAGPEHPTIETEARYIRNTLIDGIPSHETGFDGIAADINQARRWLETLLHAGSRPDRTRVVCDRETCTKHPRLIRIRDTRRPAAWSCVACGTEVPLDHAGDHCPNAWCHTVAPPRPIWSSNPDLDRWKCTSCKARFTDADYRRAHAKQLRSEGAERFVTLPEAISTLKAQGRGERTVRRWLSADVDPQAVVISYCDLVTHKVFVWWPDLWRLHNKVRTTPRVRRQSVTQPKSA